MKLLASRSDRENFLFLIDMIVIIIGILALLLVYVFFPISTSDINIGQQYFLKSGYGEYIQLYINSIKLSIEKLTSI
jgi:hypothetical protein